MAKSIKNLSLEKFRKEIKNRKILGVRRIGKNIFIDLSGEKTLYIHLKMTCHLLVKSEKLKVKSSSDYFSDKVNQYIHHIWKLKRGAKHPTSILPLSRGGNKGGVFDKTLEFSDVRKFAKIVLDDTKKINALPEIKKLGIDVMDKKFTLKKFEEILEKRKNRAVGLVLMEQELMSGIGNIYRSEILHLANILPQKKIEYLSDQERIKLYRAIFMVLKKAIKMRGTSDSDYRDTNGAPGNFQKVLKVYQDWKKMSKMCYNNQEINIGTKKHFLLPQVPKINQ